MNSLACFDKTQQMVKVNFQCPLLSSGSVLTAIWSACVKVCTSDSKLIIYTGDLNKIHAIVP